MAGTSSNEVSQLLQGWRNGDQGALDRLTPLVYDELHRMAHRQMANENSGHTLQTTALINEVYVRLLGAATVPWKDRSHFFSLAARLMRHILVDHARARGRAKRGGSNKKVVLDDTGAIPFDQDKNIVALDDALKSLAAVDPRKAQTVELRFFGGFSVKETSKILHISVGTVINDWNFAKVWLLRELQGEME